MVSHETTARPEYRLSRYVDSTLDPMEWQLGNTIHMNMAWTSYYVEARYEELNDYNSSEFVRADAIYCFAGDVEVRIICDEGIKYDFTPRTHQGSESNEKYLDGADLTLETLDGYYIVGGEKAYQVDATLKKEDTSEVSLLISKTQEGKYSFADVETNSALTITIGTARRNPTAEAQATAGQVFSPITGTSATISKDSAYAAAFQIKNFSPSYEDDRGIKQLYSDLKLTFATALPKDTTIILLDRQDKTYWHYRATADDVPSEVSLTAFQKMGGNGSEPYHIPTPPENKIYVDLNYQFIVGFSQCAKHFDDGTTLAMTLDTVTDDSIEDWDPPHLNEKVQVSVATPEFTLAPPTANGLTNTFKCIFASTDPASKWANRASALVLTPNDPIPADAQLKVRIGDATTRLYKSGSSFIVTLSLLKAGENTVTLTLESDLFPADGGTYNFTAKWLISQSKVDKAPLNGDEAAKVEDMTFTAPAKATPSLKITGDKRVLSG